MGVTHAEETRTGTRNLHRIELRSMRCKFLVYKFLECESPYKTQISKSQVTFTCKRVRDDGDCSAASALVTFCGWRVRARRSCISSQSSAVDFAS